MLRMKKTVLLYMATFIPENEVSELKQLFTSLDKNGNGMISKDEMIDGITFRANSNLFIGLAMFKKITKMDIDKEYLT
jgi:calcium-dependent protein kinase